MIFLHATQAPPINSVCLQSDLSTLRHFQEILNLRSNPCAIHSPWARHCSANICCSNTAMVSVDRDKGCFLLFIKRHLFSTFIIKYYFDCIMILRPHIISKALLQSKVAIRKFKNGNSYFTKYRMNIENPLRSQLTIFLFDFSIYCSVFGNVSTQTTKQFSVKYSSINWKPPNHWQWRVWKNF